MKAESALVSKIKKALEARGAKAIKIHGTAFSTYGTPDLVGCLPEKLIIPLPDGRTIQGLQPYGRAFAIEVKFPGKNDGLEKWARNSRQQNLYEHEPTPAQHLQLLSWQAAGAIVGVARSVADSLEILGLKS